jgi:ribose transport system permease protein
MTELAGAQSLATSTSPNPIAVRLRALLGRDVVYLAFLAILVAFAIILRDTGFLTWSNLTNIVRQTTPITVMAVGLTFTLSAGEIDLSIGSVVAVSSLTAAVFLRDVGLVAGIATGLAVGIAVGIFNGLLTVLLRIPSFLVTLGMLGLLAGVARTITDLEPVPVRNDVFNAVFGAGSVGPVSSLVIWTAAVVTVGHLALRKIRFGRHVLATGGDRAAAAYVGVRTARVRIAVLVISATSAALAGLLYAGRLNGARYTLGEEDLLTVIAAVVIGGTRLFGGRGSVIGALFGSWIMGMLNNGLILMGLEVSDQMIARGAIIVLAVALTMREPRQA